MADRRRNDRGQSAVIGFILLFGILMLLLVILQTTAVPVWNQEIEFSHNQQVQGEIEGLSDDIVQTAASGRVSSGAVTLGTRYPTRPFLLNPPPATGTLSTREPQPITITNATASGETGDYWDGTTKVFVDQHLRYRPDYNEFGSAPTTGYEHGVLYNRQDDRSVVIAERGFVNDRRINIVALNGSLVRSGVRSESVQFQPLSAPQQVTTVRSDSGPIEITVSTTLDEHTWRDMLSEQRVSEGGYVTDISVTQGDPYNTLAVTLAAGESYDLRMAKVGVGSQQTEPDAHYITTESPASITVPQSGSERVVFEVRDRYNNPVSGVDVTTLSPSSGTLEPVDPVTDENGHAVFRYEATTEGQETLTAQFGSNPDAMRTANVTVDARSVSSDGPSESQSLGLEWVGPSTGDDDRITVDADTTTTLTVESQPAVENIDISYVVNASSVGTVSPTGGTTDSGGQDTVTFEAQSVNANETVTVYAVGGGDTDVMTVTVTPHGQTTPDYGVEIQQVQEVGNSIDVTFEVTTTDTDATVRVETLNADGSVRNTETEPVVSSQPQTVRIGRRGQGQVAEVRVVVVDASGTDQESDTRPSPYP